MGEFRDASVTSPLKNKQANKFKKRKTIIKFRETEKVRKLINRWIKKINFEIVGNLEKIQQVYVKV